MNEYKFNIGDMVRLCNDSHITFQCHPDREYKDSFRVLFRFWDGSDNHYVVTTEDGYETVLPEDYLELQDGGDSDAQFLYDYGKYSLVERSLYEKLDRLGIIPNEVRYTNVGESDYSKHVIQPWAIWLDYNLNAFDADIVKRVLRYKATDPRRKDYEKIIHICRERIRQIENEEKNENH